MPPGAEPADARASSPAALRNREPILAAISPVLPRSGLVLEVASGTGEHLVHFATRLPHLEWQPSDPSPAARASIAAWSAAAGLANLRAPVALDAAADDWPVATADAILCINLAHVAPWAATVGLLAGAGRLLPAGGPLFLYGPFIEAGTPLAPSNAAFDAELRRRNPEWGLRQVEAVEAVARAHGLVLARRMPMPANNLTLVFTKVPQHDPSAATPRPPG